MPDPANGLTLEGLAWILRDHMNGTAARFAEVGARIDDLRRENAEVAGMVRDLSQIVLRQVDEVAEHRRFHEEHRQHVRQVFARMEQSDARIEEISREIWRILDAIERRGGDGGAAQT
jgi:methyl-accepting chemotaxis protein